MIEENPRSPILSMTAFTLGRSIGTDFFTYHTFSLIRQVHEYAAVFRSPHRGAPRMREFYPGIAPGHTAAQKKGEIHPIYIFENFHHIFI